MDQIINLTPHDVTILDNDSNEVARFPSQGCVRLASKIEQLTTIETDTIEVPVTITTYGRAENLPPQKAGIWLIVSQVVVQALWERPDLLFPNELIRDERGRVVGCQSLGR